METMRGTEKQIEYANDLLARFRDGLSAWKAMMPAGDARIPALTARLDAAAAKVAAIEYAGDVIDLLDNLKSGLAGQELVKAAASAVRAVEQK